MFNIVETPGTSIYVQSESAGELKLVQVALGSSGTDLPDQSGHTGHVLHTDGEIPYWAADMDSFPSMSGHSNEILSNDGSNLDWRDIDSFLPSQSGHAGDVLASIGGVLTWVTPSSLPEQSGKNGYFLTTDGADPYWEQIPVGLPEQSGNANKLLTTDGTNSSWADGVYVDDTIPYPGSKLAAIKSVTGHWYTGDIGVVGEAVAKTDDTGTGVGGVSATNGANNGRGVAGVGKVSATADTGSAIGVFGRATDTHAGGSNIAIQANAVNGANNLALYMQAGNIKSDTAQAWTLVTNTSALSVQSGLLNIDTTNSRVGINDTTPSYALDVTGDINCTGTIREDGSPLLPSQSGNSGKVLTTNGTSTSWETVTSGDSLPSQSGNSGKLLTTNGTTPSWTTVNLDGLSDVTINTPASTQILSYNGSAWVNSAAPSSLPSQSGNSGKALTTNGSNASWTAFPTELPSQSGNSGKKLITNGSNPSWAIDNLDSLSDVTINTPTSTQILSYNGSAWVNSAAPSSLPSQSGNSGKYLTTNGTTASWDNPTPWAAYTATDAALPVSGTLVVTHPADSTLKRIVQGLVMSTPSTPTNWWQLEETSGATAYDTQGAVNLTYTTMTLAQTGQFGYGAACGSNGSRITGAKSFASLTAFTIDFWYKAPSTFVDARGIFSVAALVSTTTPFVAMRSNLTAGATQLYFGGGWNVAGPTLTASTWHHITITWDGATLKSYLNGTLASTYNSSGANQSGGTSVFFGNSTGYSALFGTFDNIMIFDNYAMPVEAIVSTETYSYGGAWQPMQLGTADGQIEVTYTSNTTTSFTSHLLETHNVKVEVML